MRHIGLFEGIGGFSLAARWMGWKTIAHCEINDFCQRVLKHHFPESTPHYDIKQTDFTIYRRQCDILTGGFPCQPFSVAGKQKGKDDERFLWGEMLRAIREIQPRWILGENVFGILNNGGGWYSSRCVLKWKMRATKFNRIYFQLQVSELPTKEIGFGLLLTPTATERWCKDETEIVKTKNGTLRRKYKNGKTSSLGLSSQISNLLPTPTQADAKNVGLNGSHQNNLHKITEFHLNPEFVEEMMGFPLGWTDLKHLETQSFPK